MYNWLVSKTQTQTGGSPMTTTPVPVVWERYDSEEGYYGLVWTLASDEAETPEVVYETTEWPLKSLVGREVVQFVEASATYRFMTDEENMARFPWAK